LTVIDHIACKMPGSEAEALRHLAARRGSTVSAEMRRAVAALVAMESYPSTGSKWPGAKTRETRALVDLRRGIGHTDVRVLYVDPMMLGSPDWPSTVRAILGPPVPASDFRGRRTGRSGHDPEAPTDRRRAARRPRGESSLAPRQPVHAA
jgi:hypothetical protein